MRLICNAPFSTHLSGGQNRTSGDLQFVGLSQTGDCEDNFTIYGIDGLFISLCTIILLLTHAITAGGSSHELES